MKTLTDLLNMDASNRKDRIAAMKELREYANQYYWDARALARATELNLSSCYGWLDGTVCCPTVKSASKMLNALECLVQQAIEAEDGWDDPDQQKLGLDFIDAPVTEPSHPVEKDPKYSALLRANAEYAYLLEIYRGLYKLNETEVLLNRYRQGGFTV